MIAVWLVGREVGIAGISGRGMFGGFEKGHEGKRNLSYLDSMRYASSDPEGMMVQLLMLRLRLMLMLMLSFVVCHLSFGKSAE